MDSGASFQSRLPPFADVSPETLARLGHRMRRRARRPAGRRGSHVGIDFRAAAVEVGMIA